ncbi:MAG: hypothetical protein MJ068_01385 [Clostridia bacterium]|nr:hypothetical protein [Clostridia bacterium]
MRKRKALILITALILVTSVLAVTLTGCLKIGLKEKNVKDRIDELGGTYKYERSSPITGSLNNGHNVTSIILATLTVDDVERQVYIFYCGDDETSNWVKEQADGYLSRMREEEAQLLSDIANGIKFEEFETIYDYEHWISYQYDRMVMCGYVKAVAAIRKY